MVDWACAGIPQAPEPVGEADLFLHVLDGKQQFEVGKTCFDVGVGREVGQVQVLESGNQIRLFGWVGNGFRLLLVVRGTVGG